MVANLLALIFTAITFMVAWAMTSGQVSSWQLLTAAAVYFALANLVAGLSSRIGLSLPDRRILTRVVSHRGVIAVAVLLAASAWFALLELGFGLHRIASILCSSGIGVAVFLTAHVVGQHLLRKLEVDELLNRHGSAPEIVEFLTRSRPTTTTAAWASAALLLSVATSIGCVLFVHSDPGGSFGDLLVGVTLIGTLVGGVVAGGHLAALWTFVEHREKEVLALIQASPLPACQKAIEDYRQWKSDERARTVFCFCPQCSQRVVPPEDVTGLTHFVCDTCGHRMGIDAATTQVSMAISTNAFDTKTWSNCPILISEGRLLLCSGESALTFDLREIDNVKLGLRVTLRGDVYDVSFTSGKHRVEMAGPNAGFRKAFLDVYGTLHPYHGDHNCWYCGTRVGQPGMAVPLPIHKVVSRSVTEKSAGWEVGVSFEKRLLQVPRCEHCVNTHRHADRYEWAKIMGGAAALFGVFVLFFAFFRHVDSHAENRDFPEWVHGRHVTASLLLTTAILIPGGIWSLISATSAQRMSLRKAGVRPQADLELYPPYRIAWDQGFRVGEKPTGREMYYGRHETG